MSFSPDEHERRLRTLLTSLKQYRDEEQAQGRQESDERRRAWHDGRASAYLDAIERLQALLPDGSDGATDAPARHN